MAAVVEVADALGERSTQLRTYVFAGATLGLAWGLAARAWMRLVSDSPEFTWTGTGFILAAATLAGAGLGAVEGARRRRHAKRWRFAALAVLLLGVGAGIIMLPIAWLGGAALSGRWPLPARIGLAFLALIPFALVITDPAPLWSETRRSAVFLGFTALSAALALGTSVTFRPWPPGGPDHRVQRAATRRPLKASAERELSRVMGTVKFVQ